MQPSVFSLFKPICCRIVDKCFCHCFGDVLKPFNAFFIDQILLPFRLMHNVTSTTTFDEVHGSISNASNYFNSIHSGVDDENNAVVGLPDQPQQPPKNPYKRWNNNRWKPRKDKGRGGKVRTDKKERHRQQFNLLRVWKTRPVCITMLAQPKQQ
eukprot:4633425-Amphidinium_carterae.1